MQKTEDKLFDNLVLTEQHGPFDIIGDVHGCFGELVELLQRLDYQIYFEEETACFQVTHPRAHRAVFVGDLVDRGPDSPGVLRLVMDMAAQGMAYCVSGNHDDKLLRMLKGCNVKVRHGLEITKAQLDRCDRLFIERVKGFLDSLPHHILLDEGRLVVAHAGLEERLHGHNSKGVRALCLYGPTTGETDAMGLPVRIDWAAAYCGQSVVVYGHTPVHEPHWRNNTINIDTGCVFGGKLTALSYPEQKLTFVEARDVYAQSVRDFVSHAPQPSSQD